MLVGGGGGGGWGRRKAVVGVWYSGSVDVYGLVG